MLSAPKIMSGRSRIDADALAAQYDASARTSSRTGTLHRDGGSVPTSSTRAPGNPLTVKYGAEPSLALKATNSDKVKYQAIKDHYKTTHGGQKLPFEARMALRPMPGSKIDAASIEAMHGALKGEGELRNHVLHPEADALVGDRQYKQPKAGKKDDYLGGGAFNEVHSRKFKLARTSSPKAFFGIGRVKTRAVKESKPLVMTMTDPKTKARVQIGHPHAARTGIDYNKPRVADRNVAARTSDKHLGLDIAPKSSAGIFGGKPCLAMKIAPGITCAREYLKHPEMIKDPEFQHQMSDAEVSAFASGHTDPHMENVMVKRVEKKSLFGGGTKVTFKVTLVDNDTCHSPKFANPDRPPLTNEAFSVQFRSTGLPAYMDAATARKVEELDIASYAKDLRKNLTEDEVQCSCGRMTLLKEHVDFLRAENRIVKDWKAFTDVSGKACKGGSVIEGTLAMPGVQQGFKSDGRPNIVPRSMLLRDVQDAQVGRHKIEIEDKDGKKEKKGPDFKTALGPALHQRILDFDRQDRTLMPPSGNPRQYRMQAEVFPEDSVASSPPGTGPYGVMLPAQSRTEGGGTPGTGPYGVMIPAQSQTDRGRTPGMGPYGVMLPAQSRTDGGGTPGTEPYGVMLPAQSRTEGGGTPGTGPYGVMIPAQSRTEGGGTPGTGPYGVMLPAQSGHGEEALEEPVVDYSLTPNNGSSASANAQERRPDGRDDMLAEIRARRGSISTS